jgi:hypothetical protein
LATSTFAVPRALLLALLAPLAAATDFHFLTPQVLTFEAGTHPALALAADATGDGLTDVIVASGTQGLIVVRNSEGYFEFGGAMPTVLGSPVARWETADLNADGRADLVVKLQDARLRVLLADEGGAFAASTVLDLSGLGDFGGLALLDANGDGQTDAAMLLDDKLRVAFGDGAGHLGALGPVISGPFGLGPALELRSLTLDGDGLTDLASIASSGSGLGVAQFHNDGAGNFAPDSPFTHGSSDADYHDAAVGDLDADGWPDLIISFLDHRAFPDPGDVQVLHGTGVALQGDYPQGVQPMPELLGSIALGDLDGDGRDDLAGSSAGGKLWLFRSSAALGFEPGQQVPLAYAAGDVLVADLDDNGVRDVLITHASDDALSILRSTALPAGWSDLGVGLHGSAGIPQLQGTGALVAGQSVQLRLTDAAPLAPVTLVLGLSPVDLPFKGGQLVPAADVLVAGLITSAAGQLTLTGRWPAGLPAGFSMWMQEWIADAAGPKGFASSNGLGAKTAPANLSSPTGTARGPRESTDQAARAHLGRASR